MLPSAVLTQLKGTHLTACGPLPVSMGKWLQPACSTAVEQDRPSVTTLLPAAKSRLASFSISRLRKPLMTVSPGLFGSGHERFVRVGLAAEGPAGRPSC